MAGRNRKKKARLQKLRRRHERIMTLLRLRGEDFRRSEIALALSHRAGVLEHQIAALVESMEKDDRPERIPTTPPFLRHPAVVKRLRDLAPDEEESYWMAATNQERRDTLAEHRRRHKAGRRSRSRWAIGPAWHPYKRCGRGINHFTSPCKCWLCKNAHRFDRRTGKIKETA